MKHLSPYLLWILFVACTIPTRAESDDRVSYKEYVKAHSKGEAESKAQEPPAAQSKPSVDVTQTFDVLKLKNGREFKNVKIVSFSSQTLTLSWSGGVASIEYKLLPDDIRVAAEQKRPGAIVATKKTGNSNAAMTPRGPFYVEGNIIEKSKGVIIVECSGPPFTLGNKDGKIPLMNGKVAIKDYPGYNELGVRDTISLSAMRVGDYDTRFGQVPLLRRQ